MHPGTLRLQPSSYKSLMAKCWGTHWHVCNAIGRIIGDVTPCKSVIIMPFKKNIKTYVAGKLTIFLLLSCLHVKYSTIVPLRVWMCLKITLPFARKVTLSFTRIWLFLTSFSQHNMNDVHVFIEYIKWKFQKRYIFIEPKRKYLSDLSIKYCIKY